MNDIQHPVPPPGHPVRRRLTRAVRVGDLHIGGTHPILIQSMVISETSNTEAVVAEIRELVEAGCPLVRLTAPSLREAENLRVIRRRLHQAGIRVPLVADIHFTPNAALLAAELVEKVRINPGNYADKKRFEVREYTDREYAEELERVRGRFLPLVRRLKETGAALRIGVNHGSLSDRIVNRYGDTPAGMVESALEFVRICEGENYREIVISMKSSIAGVTVGAYRLLAEKMNAHGMDYPFHLGVTEAGDGLEARIKSAVGIGTLLLDGMGDTIRVSLAEDSKHEIPAARALLEAVERAREDGRASHVIVGSRREAEIRGIIVAPSRRLSASWTLRGLSLGGDAPVRVEEELDPGRPESDPRSGPESGPEASSEILSLRRTPDLPAAELIRWLAGLRDRETRPMLLEWRLSGQGEIHTIEALLPYVDGLSLDVLSHEPELAPPGDSLPEALGQRVRLLARLAARRERPIRWLLPSARPRISGTRDGAPENTGVLALAISDLCREEGLDAVGFLCAQGPDFVPRVRALASALESRPELIFLRVPAWGADAPLLAGPLLLQGIGDALCLASADGARIAAPAPWPPGGREWKEGPVSSAFAILQACRVRLTRVEFIACPSCGRTQFDLQSTAQKIRSLTEHLKGVKIAIMGCVVNGPGEMADADFGYVGSGAGRVDLFVGRERAAQGIPAEEAPSRLLELIREKGKWVDP